MTATIESTPPQRISRSPLAVLALSVLGISFAAPLVRLSDAPALVIAAWRLGFSLCLIAIALLVTGQWRDWRRLSRRDVWLSVAAGLHLQQKGYRVQLMRGEGAAQVRMYRNATQIWHGMNRLGSQSLRFSGVKSMAVPYTHQSPQKHGMPSSIS